MDLLASIAFSTNMKRDMDLCRAILLKLEESERDVGWVEIDVPNYSREQTSAHIRLLAEAGLIDAEHLTSMDGAAWKAKRLTWAGHEFIEAAKNETIWNRAKSSVKEKTGILTIEVLKLALTEATKGLFTGNFHLP